MHQGGSFVAFNTEARCDAARFWGWHYPHFWVGGISKLDPSSIALLNPGCMIYSSTDDGDIVPTIGSIRTWATHLTRTYAVSSVRRSTSTCLLQTIVLDEGAIATSSDNKFAIYALCKKRPRHLAGSVYREER